MTVCVLLGYVGKSSWINGQQQCCTGLRPSFRNYCLSGRVSLIIALLMV